MDFGLIAASVGSTARHKRLSSGEPLPVVEFDGDRRQDRLGGGDRRCTGSVKTGHADSRDKLLRTATVVGLVAHPGRKPWVVMLQSQHECDG